METRETAKTSYEKTVAKSRSGWLGKAFLQIELPSEALSAIDRSMGFGPGDTVVCEATCLGYAAHALEKGAGELWLVPPLLGMGDPTQNLLDAFWKALHESSHDVLGTLASHGDAFRGIADSVPSGPFRLLVTTENMSDGQPATEWPLYNGRWVDMLDSQGSSGAVLYLPTDGEGGRTPPISVAYGSEGYDFMGFTSAIELPGGYVALAKGGPTSTVTIEYDASRHTGPLQAKPLTASFHMEDLSDPRDPWSAETTELTLAANGGVLNPSVIRHGVKVIKETTLGELASRVSRGTALSEKDLETEREESKRTDFNHSVWALVDMNRSSSAGLAMPGMSIDVDRRASEKECNQHYVDGTCFVDGAITPLPLRTMPKGQERYVIESHDGEVLLVTRNSKETVVYTAKKPTLIGNSVFVVRLASDIDRDYLACWMRGGYAQGLLSNKGKFLTKGILECLPVPILNEEDTKRTVRYERSIGERIGELRRQIRTLESTDHYSPLVAKRKAEGR